MTGSTTSASTSPFRRQLSDQHSKTSPENTGSHDGHRRSRKSIMTAMKWGAGKLWLLSHSLLLPVTILSGQEKHSKETLTIQVIGADQPFITYVSELLFSDIPHATTQRHIGLWALKTYQATPDTNLILVRADRFFMTFLQSKGYITIPEWITTILAIEEHPVGKRTSVRRNVRRVIQRRITDEYTYETSNDPKKLEFFYHTMYVPYIRRRYGTLAIITPYSRMKELFKAGRLLFVKKDNACTQGVLIKTLSPTTATLTHVGALETDADTCSRGIGPTLYYFSMLWAKDNNISHLDLGICRGFLNDGVLQNKRKWNAAIRPWRSRNIPDQFSEIIGMRLGSTTESLHQCLYHNPFIYLDKESRLHGMIFVPSNHELASHELRHYQKTYVLPGLASLAVTTPQRLKNQETPMTVHIINQKGGNAS